MRTGQIENLRWKLPNLLYFFLKDGRKVELLDSMSVDSHRFLSILSGEEFPTEDELKGLCDHFKLRYSTLKTWNVLHLVED